MLSQVIRTQGVDEEPEWSEGDHVLRKGHLDHELGEEQHLGLPLTQVGDLYLIVSGAEDTGKHIQIQNVLEKLLDFDLGLAVSELRPGFLVSEDVKSGTDYDVHHLLELVFVEGAAEVFPLFRPYFIALLKENRISKQRLQADPQIFSFVQIFALSHVELVH